MGPTWVPHVMMPRRTISFPSSLPSSLAHFAPRVWWPMTGDAAPTWCGRGGGPAASDRRPAGEKSSGEAAPGRAAVGAGRGRRRRRRHCFLCRRCGRRAVVVGDRARTFLHACSSPERAEGTARPGEACGGGRGSGGGRRGTRPPGATASQRRRREPATGLTAAARGTPR
jgi:hypothetical protein